MKPYGYKLSRACSCCNAQPDQWGTPDRTREKLRTWKDIAEDIFTVADLLQPDPQLEDWKRDWELRHALDAMRERYHFLLPTEEAAAP